ncbi:O-antigen ligase family protein [Microbacterium telephonicum]|uniref:O-antigen ligase n=1 Tax=Microbacterium telephonicum TaxID=1714841 RepID=A0A498C1G7_9MICO|nr:O-antigen ligase family protein [Microbacterium telephonicum]RLK49704.1 O-antigen ligase [Microbacterium telephonicum]
MKALRHVLRATTVREAIDRVPEAFYERFAFAFLLAWLAAPLLLWWVGPVIGTDITFLAWVNLQVGLGALILVALRLAAHLVPPRDVSWRVVLRDELPLVLLGMFLLLAVLATALSPTAEALDGDWYRRESIWTFAAYVGFFFLASRVVSGVLRRALLAGVIALALITCIVTLVAAISAGWHTDEGAVAHRAIAYFHQFNHYGYLLAVACVLAAAAALTVARRVLRGGLIAVFGILLLTLLLNDTLGAYLAVVAGLAGLVTWLAVLRRLHVTTLLLLAAVAVVVHVLADALGVGVAAEIASLGGDMVAVSEGSADAASAGTGRWGLWMITLEQIAVSPWSGHGIEGIASLLPGGYGRPHDEYLQYAVFFGIPALIAYVSAVVVVLVRVVRRGRAVDGITVCATAAAFAYLISALFGNTMYYTAPLLFLLLGIAWAGVRAAGSELLDAESTPLAEDRTAPTPII